MSNYMQTGKPQRPRCHYCGRFVRGYQQRATWPTGTGWLAEWLCSNCGPCVERI